MEDRLLKRDLPEWQTLVDVDVDGVRDHESSVKATPRADVSAGLQRVSTPYHNSCPFIPQQFPQPLHTQHPYNIHRVTGKLGDAMKSDLGMNYGRGSEDNMIGGGGGIVIESYNVHRLIIAGITVASKFFSHVFYTNSRYAKVGGLPQSELNVPELQLLNDSRLYPIGGASAIQQHPDQLLLTHTTMFHPQLSFPKTICVSSGKDRACSHRWSSTTPLRATGLRFPSANNEIEVIERSTPFVISSSTAIFLIKPDTKKPYPLRASKFHRSSSPTICAQLLLFIYFRWV
ncbi:hypothetical protein FRC03_006320 [Tulasnella sp. 419]|nr:hypothetical protein FRC03_006320 [Tulasnella sp. 419]